MTWQDYIINWAALTCGFNQPIWWLKRERQATRVPIWTLELILVLYSHFINFVFCLLMYKIGRVRAWHEWFNNNTGSRSVCSYYKLYLRKIRHWNQYSRVLVSHCLHYKKLVNISCVEMCYEGMDTPNWCQELAMMDFVLPNCRESTEIKTFNKTAFANYTTLAICLITG